MPTSPSNPDPVNRRQFIQTAGVAGLGASALGTAAAGISAAPRLLRRTRRGANERVNVLCIGVVGTIGSVDRKQVAGHPAVEIVGLCDVDSQAIAKAAERHPDAFTCADYREAFDKHGDAFDAVIVSTPDHTHAPIMLTALANGKHCYGQKPLVQQLSEVAAIEAAAAANPRLVTQVGNQRMGKTGRQYAVEILEKDLLGKPVESHVWVNGPPDGGNAYFYYGPVPEPSTPPATIDWPLWLGSAEDAPYRDGLVGLRWRSSWDYGTGQLGDWCTHLLDVPVYAYNLKSPVSVISQTREPSGFYHAQHVASTLAYPDPGGRFANGVLPLHYSDKGQRPSRAALGLPPGEFAGTGVNKACSGSHCPSSTSSGPNNSVSRPATRFLPAHCVAAAIADSRSGKARAADNAAASAAFCSSLSAREICPMSMENARKASTITNVTAANTVMVPRRRMLALRIAVVPEQTLFMLERAL